MNKASNCPRRGALLRRIRVNLTAIRLIGLSFGLSLVTPLFAAEPLIARITTNIGDITAELNDRAAPTTVANFVNLAQRGFYDGLTFHRWEKNFMIQGGDPLGDGTGGPGYRFSGEIILRHNQPGHSVDGQFGARNRWQSVFHYAFSDSAPKRQTLCFWQGD